jgi:hypothetical protein
MHSSTTWGHSKPEKTGDAAIRIIQRYKLKSVLDYGTGHGTVPEYLRENLTDVKVMGFEPGLPRSVRFPDEVDLLMSGDVMEHIEPEFLKNVIDVQKETATRFMYHRIHMLPANAILPDGRNAHLIQEDGEWWKKQYECDEWCCYRMVKDPHNMYVDLYLRRL